MLNLNFSRREFLQVGSVGAGATALSLSDPVFADVQKNDKSIIWIWLSGGPSHFETFNAVGIGEGYESVIGSARLSTIGRYPIRLGGLWTKLIRHADRFNVVANFSHRDSSHAQATHWVNSAHYSRDRAASAGSTYPSHGSIVSAIHGATNSSGIPTYVSQGRINGDGPAWLGGAYKAFDPKAKNNLSPSVDVTRLNTRKNLLSQLDKIDIANDSGRSMDKYKDQAFSTILGDAKQAFDDSEWDKAKELYGDSSIGKQLWLANRLTQHGSKFVTANYGGWDMHSNIKDALERRVPAIDKALGGLLSSMNLKDTMVIVTGEFGRTKLNQSQGRDHWPSIVPLMIAGGDYEYGRVIGNADKKNYVPDTTPYGPIDLQATMFHHLGIDPLVQRTDTGGRPRYLLDGDYRTIL